MGGLLSSHTGLLKARSCFPFFRVRERVFNCLLVPNRLICPSMYPPVAAFFCVAGVVASPPFLFFFSYVSGLKSSNDRLFVFAP